MKFIANINIMPLKALLDPQGKAVSRTMQETGFGTIDDVRIGKHIELKVEAENTEQATKIVDEACKKILSNQVMESYEFTIKSA